jgi:hypothetical protein
VNYELAAATADSRWGIPGPLGRLCPGASRAMLGSMDASLAPTRGWTECPGCGLSLPGSSASEGSRLNASAACRYLYAEATSFEFGHLAILGRHHQLLVDTYGAQHAGPKVPRIGPAFGLIGLCLALEDGASGPAVRAAHQYLAQHYRGWPAFELPARTAYLTVFDLALATTPSDFERILHRWAGEVWLEWAPAHATVAALIQERLPRDIRDRLRAMG